MCTILSSEIIILSPLDPPLITSNTSDMARKGAGIYLLLLIMSREGVYSVVSSRLLSINVLDGTENSESIWNDHVFVIFCLDGIRHDRLFGNTPLNNVF